MQQEILLLFCEWDKMFKVVPVRELHKLRYGKLADVLVKTTFIL